MKKSEFAGFHPIVNFIYFAVIICFSMVMVHPACLVISLASSFLYSVLLKGTKAIKTNLLYIIPIVLATGLLNPLFNHQGATVIGYFPDGNPLTAESVIYGAVSGCMVAAVICWFSCYNHIMTSDKFIYLFGKIIPAMSLILSMTLRFVPRFIRQMKFTADMQKIAGNKKGKIKSSVEVVSSVMTWSLENAVDTSDSMRARGYGLCGRTAFSVFKLTKRDVVVLCAIVVMVAYVLWGIINEAVYFNFFPVILYADKNIYHFSVFVIYTFLCFLPVLIEAWEVIRWKRLTSKI